MRYKMYIISIFLNKTVLKVASTYTLRTVFFTFLSKLSCKTYWPLEIC